jgi:hypothetical protein
MSSSSPSSLKIVPRMSNILDNVSVLLNTTYLVEMSLLACRFQAL